MVPRQQPDLVFGPSKFTVIVRFDTQMYDFCMALRSDMIQTGNARKGATLKEGLGKFRLLGVRFGI